MSTFLPPPGHYGTITDPNDESLVAYLYYNEDPNDYSITTRSLEHDVPGEPCIEYATIHHNPQAKPAYIRKLALLTLKAHQ